MGRQVRRVALDFEWPTGIPYSGFIRPAELDTIQCTTCEGRGWSPEGREMHERWYGYVPFDPAQTGSEPFTRDTPGILDYARRKIQDERAFYDNYLGARGEETVRREADRLCALWNATWQHHLSQDDVDAMLADDDQILDGLTHRFDTATRKWDRIERDAPTQREVNIWGLGLQGGLVQVPAYAVQKAEAARCGVTLTCAVCDGEGSSYRDDAHRGAFEDWEPTEPPKGEGWQLWETVSEGSPVSPVCASAEDLARHMEHRDRASEDGMGYEGWLRFITECGWAPSGIGVGDVIVPGHVALAMA